MLTAAHCSQGKTGELYSPKQRWIVAGDSFPNLEKSKKLIVSKIQVHDAFDVQKMKTRKNSYIKINQANDIAIWTLKNDVLGIRPAKIAEASLYAEKRLKDFPLTIYGFGKESQWQAPSTMTQLNMAVTKYSPMRNVRYTKTIKERGIRRKHKYIESVSSYSDSEFFAGGSGLADTCAGDSGGPAFIRDMEGNLVLLGLTSRGTYSCEGGGVYTVVPAFRLWINMAHNTDKHG